MCCKLTEAEMEVFMKNYKGLLKNIEKRQKYKIVFYAKADGVINLEVSFVGSEKREKLASNNIRCASYDCLSGDI
ncbi:hypothetical protein JHK87_052254 [Glycine soja]|nr:hypothetical protein JHK87_052254 [Glycine soja]